MGCGSSQSSTTSASIPEWVSDAGKSVYSNANQFYNQGFTPPPDNRVAGFNPTQTDVFSRLAAYQPPNVTGQSLDLIGKAVQPIGTQRVVDQNGTLGPIADYMNPYTQNALNPAIDQITKNAAAQGKQIDSQAMGAHAFGDARQGVMQNEHDFQTNKAIGDTAGSMYDSAYKEAMGLRGQDLANKMTTDVANRTANMQGASSLMSTAAAGQNSFLSLMQSLLGAGTQQQQQQQSQLDVPMQDWQLKTQDAYDRLAALVSVLGQTPYSRSQTTTTNNPGSIFGALGSLAGGLLGTGGIGGLIG